MYHVAVVWRFSIFCSFKLYYTNTRTYIGNDRQIGQSKTNPANVKYINRNIGPILCLLNRLKLLKWPGRKYLKYSYHISQYDILFYINKQDILSSIAQGAWKRKSWVESYHYHPLPLSLGGWIKSSGRLRIDENSKWFFDRVFFMCERKGGGRILQSSREKRG